MESYQIGKIEGRWENLVPPIQGGKFLKLGEEGITGDVVDSSSAGSSGQSTPDHIFRNRKGRQATPPSSVSSIELEEEKTRMSHIDAKTHEELELDLAKYPPLDAEVQDEIVRKYRLLNERIKAEGLYQCNYWMYLPEVIRYCLLFATSFYLLRIGWYKTSAIFLGFFWHQLTFTAHDAGHMGITHNFHGDTLIGIFIADFLGGLSIGWWKRNHNVHHIVTNSPEHDPDIQHMPLFAVSHRFLESLRSSFYDRVMAYDPAAKVLISAQHHLYFIILAFGRFNLYRLTWMHILFRQAPRKGPSWWHYWVELIGLMCFWAWFGYGILYKSLPTAWDRFLYLMISHIVTSPVHVQITLSHFCMSTADLGQKESFPQKMLRTTMDVDCPPWLDFIHGGLQFQVIHHLYPRIPRHNLRRSQKLVQEFCDDVNIPYALYGFVDGNKQVTGRLEEVARQAAILAECQKVMAQNRDYGHT
jgi:sphingolipid 8-(E)-desaturase